MHSKASLLSAYGIGLATLRRVKKESIEKLLIEEEMEFLIERISVIKEELKVDMLGQGVELLELGTDTTIFLKSGNSDTAFPTMFKSVDEMKRDFEKSFKKQFGFL